MMKTDTNSSDIVRDRCSAYLLGEMTAQQTAAFESELDDPIVSNALLRESELLCGIAMFDSFGMALTRTDANDPVHSTRHSIHRHQDVSMRSLAIAVATLAATVLTFATYRFFDRSDSNSAAMQASALPLAGSFELEVAKTWVDPAIDWDVDDREDFSASANDDFTSEIDDTEPDDTFEWMVAAVAASIEQGEDSNDG